MISGARLRVLLAVLLWRANQPVPVDELAELVWDGAPPSGTPGAIRALVRRLRRGLDERVAARIVTRAPGYAVEVSGDELDALRFEALTQAAGAAAQAGRWAEAARTAAQALGLWRGEPLADVPSQLLRDWWVPHLSQLHLQALDWRIEADLHEGRHQLLIPELRELTTRHPLRERFHGQLMLALVRSGQQAEALAAYQQARHVLASELGVGPGTELRQLHERILARDASLPAAPAAAWAGPVTARPDDPGAMTAPSVAGALAPGVPRQLPAAVTGFTGRAGELAVLARMPGREDAGPPGTAVISAIGGAPGVGKTALAIHWAHQVAAQFGDGQLYVNLRGFDPAGAPAAPAEAIRGFLDALGVAPDRIPPALDAQAGLYRSLLSGKQVLIVLDNARDEHQVRPLLPGSPGCVVVVTSRSQLTGLAASNGARLITLDVLTAAEAREMLGARLGAARAAAEPGAVGEIAGLCGGLPLALAIAAARAAARPQLPLTVLAAELRDAAGRLDALDTADPAASVHTAFSWSYQQLSPAAARMFRLLGLHPGPDFAVGAAASLAGVRRAEARRLLGELARAHLLTEQAPGRFRCHDLLRLYASEQAATTGTRAARRAARARLLDYYLHTAASAHHLLYPRRHRLGLGSPLSGVTTDGLTSHGQALAWFDAEHRGLVAAVGLAASNGFDQHAWQLAFSLDTFFHRRGHWQDWAATQHTALAAARRLGDHYAQALAHCGITHAQVMGRLPGDALNHLAEALHLQQEAGDAAGEADVHLHISFAFLQGRRREALASSWQALRLAQSLPTRDELLLADALNQVGWVLAKLGQYRQALPYCEQAVALSRKADYKHMLPVALDSLAYVNRHLGRHAEAAGCYRRAVELFDELGDRYRKAATLSDAGDAQRAAGDLAAAQHAWAEALAILESLHHPDADAIRAKLHRVPQ